MTEFDKYFMLRGVTLNTTTACNLACSYCFEKNKTGKAMSLENAKNIIRFVCEHFERTTLKNDPDAKLGISFFGGEPLLNFDAIKVVVEETANKDYPVEYGITTNLTVLTEEMIGLFYENNFGILVSIDGTKEIHDQNRCNSYDTVASNVKRLIDAGLALNTEARITIPPNAVDALVDGVKNVIELGIDNIAPSLVFDQEWTRWQIEILSQQIDKLYDYVIKTYNDPNNKRNINVKTINEFLEICLDVKQSDLSPCGFGKNVYISIGPDGEIGSCHQNHTNVFSKKEMILGNILTGELYPDRIEKIRGTYGGRKYCQSCNLNHVCRGGCPVENYNLTGDYEQMPEIWCIYMRIVYNTAKKYQQELLSAKNIRNRRLNVIKTNLEMSDKLDKIAKLNIDDAKYLLALAEIQSFIFNNERIIMPSFKYSAERFLLNEALKAINELENICKQTSEVKQSG